MTSVHPPTARRSPIHSPRRNRYELKRFGYRLENRATRPSSALSTISHEPASQTAHRVRQQIPRSRRWGEKGSLILDFTYTLKKGSLARTLHDNRGLGKHSTSMDRPLSRSSLASNPGSPRMRSTTPTRDGPRREDSLLLNSSRTQSRAWDDEQNSVAGLVGQFGNGGVLERCADAATRAFAIQTCGVTRPLPEGRMRYEDLNTVSDSLSLRYLEGIVRDGISSAWPKADSLQVSADGEDRIRVKIKTSQVGSDLGFLAYMNAFLRTNPHAVYYKLRRHSRTWHVKLEGHLVYLIHVGRAIGTPTDAAAIMQGMEKSEPTQQTALWQEVAKNALH